MLVGLVWFNSAHQFSSFYLYLILQTRTGSFSFHLVILCLVTFVRLYLSRYSQDISVYGTWGSTRHYISEVCSESIPSGLHLPVLSFSFTQWLILVRKKNFELMINLFF